MGKEEIEAFLSDLTVRLKCSISTYRQAFNVIVFLYNRVLDHLIVGFVASVKRKRKLSPPVVLSKTEIARVLSNMGGTHQLMAKLLYGCGLRLMECIRLRVQDIDFEQWKLYIRQAKGGKDRVALLS